MITLDDLITIMDKFDKASPYIIGFSVAIVVVALFIDYKIKAEKKKVLGLKKALPENANGIIYGKKGKKVVFSPTNDEGHIGVFSAPGTGKTSAVGIQTLRSWDGTSFVIDISGDISSNCPDMPNKHVFEPDNPNTLKYSVFAPIDRLNDVMDKNEALAQLAILLMPETPDMNDNARFFVKNGRKILTAAFIAFYHQNMDFIPICEKVLGSSFQELFREIDASKNKDAIMYINSFQGTSEQNTAGCKQSADDAVNLFATNGKIKRSLGRAYGAIEPMQIEKCNIFILVEDEKLELYAPLLNIITSQFMQYISKRKVTEKSKKILLFLDEYASLKLDAETILAALRKYRKKGARLCLMTQNLSDLDILYGVEVRNAIMSNLAFKVLLGGLNDVVSQEYFAKLIGHKEVMRKSYSTSADNHTRTESEAKEYKIEPADLDRQGKDTAILIFSGIPDGYMLLKKNYYFK